MKNKKATLATFILLILALPVGYGQASSIPLTQTLARSIELENVSLGSFIVELSAKVVRRSAWRTYAPRDGDQQIRIAEIAYLNHDDPQARSSRLRHETDVECQRSALLLPRIEGKV